MTGASSTAYMFASRVHPFGAYDVWMSRMHAFGAERRAHVHAREKSVLAQSVAHLCLASTSPPVERASVKKRIIRSSLSSRRAAGGGRRQQVAGGFREAGGQVLGWLAAGR